MHIHDKHIRKEMKKRMKHLFVKRSQALVDPVPLTNQEGSVDHSSGGPAIPPSSALPTASTLLPEASNEDGLRGIAREQAHRIAEDETDQEPVTNSTIIRCPIPLHHLFDFSQPDWANLYEHAARRSFDKELELYELLDLDAAGKEEINLDLDDSTGDLMAT
jgi:hypothetical protein